METPTQTAPVEPRVRYAFTVRGTTKSGCKIVAHGHVRDVAAYPESAFNRALEVCLTDLGISRDEFTFGAKGGVSLRQLKK